jgi:hypothetical protein
LRGGIKSKPQRLKAAFAFGDWLARVELVPIPSLLVSRKLLYL